MEFTAVTKSGKLLNTLSAVVDVTLGVVVAVVGLPTVNRGAKVVVMGKVVGTTCGLAGRDFRSMLSGPIRMTAVANCALLKSMENPASVNPTNGVAVPGVTFHNTMQAGGVAHQTSDSASLSSGGRTGSAGDLYGRLRIDGRGIEIGRRGSKRATSPSTQTGSPAATPAGNVTDPVSTAKAAGDGFCPAVAPLPAKL